MLDFIWDRTRLISFSLGWNCYLSYVNSQGGSKESEVVKKKMAVADALVDKKA